MRATEVRRALVALAVTFVVFGGLDGSWSARLPALKHRLGLDDGQLGLVILLVTLAATAVLPAAGWLAARLGSRTPAAFGLGLAAAGISAAAFVPSYAAVLPAAGAVGIGWGIADVAANAHGLVLEQRTGRPILSALHGGWSVGLLAGSGIAAAAAGAGVGLRVQFPVVAAVGVLALAVFTPRLLPGTRAEVGTAQLALPRGPLALPAFLMFCGFFVESAAISWTAVFLAGPAHASAAVAAAGLVSFSVAMALSRLVGDRLLVRWGMGGLARRGGAVMCAGIALALATRSPAPALVGFACLGAGTAPIIPALFRVGGTVPGISSGAGIAAIATAGYAGGVVNGPAIGFLARGVGLTAALSLVAVAAALIGLLGPSVDCRA